LKITELGAEEDVQKLCRYYWKGFGHDSCLVMGIFSSNTLHYMLQ